MISSPPCSTFEVWAGTRAVLADQRSVRRAVPPWEPDGSFEQIDNPVTHLSHLVLLTNDLYDLVIGGDRNLKNSMPLPTDKVFIVKNAPDFDNLIARCTN